GAECAGRGGGATPIQRPAGQRARRRPPLRAPPRRPRHRQPAAAHKAERANMGKKSRERALSDNEAKAVARMLRVSPQKLNLVAQLIRGKKVASALADLEFSRKRI